MIRGEQVEWGVLLYLYKGEFDYTASKIAVEVSAVPDEVKEELERLEPHSFVAKIVVIKHEEPHWFITPTGRTYVETRLQELAKSDSALN